MLYLPATQEYLETESLYRAISRLKEAAFTRGPNMILPPEGVDPDSLRGSTTNKKH